MRPGTVGKGTGRKNKYPDIQRGSLQNSAAVQGVDGLLQTPESG